MGCRGGPLWPPVALIALRAGSAPDAQGFSRGGGIRMQRRTTTGGCPYGGGQIAVIRIVAANGARIRAPYGRGATVSQGTHSCVPPVVRRGCGFRVSVGAVREPPVLTVGDDNLAIVRLVGGAGRSRTPPTGEMREGQPRDAGFRRGGSRTARCDDRPPIGFRPRYAGTGRDLSLRDFWALAGWRRGADNHGGLSLRSALQPGTGREFAPPTGGGQRFRRGRIHASRAFWR